VTRRGKGRINFMRGNPAGLSARRRGACNNDLIRRNPQ
jgi:hypothetical protein